MPLFVFTSITAPVGGVLAGGWVIDKIGGYNTQEGVVKCLGYLAVGGSIAVSAAIPASFLENPYQIFILIWILLFFGGGKDSCLFLLLFYSSPLVPHCRSTPRCYWHLHWLDSLTLSIYMHV